MTESPERGTYKTRFNARGLGSVISSDRGAPTADDELGSLYMRFDTGALYRKFAAGASNWVMATAESSGSFAPADNNLVAAPFDPANATGTFTLTTAGTVYVVKAHLPVGGIVTNVVVPVTTAGSVLTSGQCFAGVYQAGTLIGTTADQATAWASTGALITALTGGPFTLGAGDVYIAAFFNGTTGPTLSAGNKTVLVNVGLGATVSRFGTADTGRTTSLAGTLGTIAATPNAIWLGLS